MPKTNQIVLLCMLIMFSHHLLACGSWKNTVEYLPNHEKKYEPQASLNRANTTTIEAPESPDSLPGCINYSPIRSIGSVDLKSAPASPIKNSQNSIKPRPLLAKLSRILVVDDNNIK